MDRYLSGAGQKVQKEPQAYSAVFDKGSKIISWRKDVFNKGAGKLAVHMQIKIIMLETGGFYRIYITPQSVKRAIL